MSLGRKSRRAFTLVELMLFAAIPILGFVGFKTLLDTRTGTFIEDPGPDSPGWTALVDPSPVLGVVEMDGESITGVAVVVSIGSTARGGAVILVPGDLEVSSLTLSSRTPEQAVAAVGTAMKLRIPEVEVVDSARWAMLLDSASYTLNNPDPVPGEGDEVLFEVGAVEVTGDRAAAFLGRTVDGADSLASLVRRELFWSELLENPPPVQNDQLSRTLFAVAHGTHEVVLMPLERGDSGNPIVSPDRTEALVRRVVAFPAASEAGDRPRLRIEDRTGNADLDAAARSLGRLGVEVVAVANAAVFDDVPTTLSVEAGTSTEVLEAAFPGIPVVISPTALPGDAPTLRLGPDYRTVLNDWNNQP